MDKHNIIEHINLFKSVKFTEKQENVDVIGYIQDHDRLIQISFLGDNSGKYLKLSYFINDIKYNDEMLANLNARIVNGRWTWVSNRLTLYSIIPILKESILEVQLIHSLNEIWDMYTIVNHFSSLSNNTYLGSKSI
ncbi:MAG: hypothetical protein HUJ61_06640 [Bacilli bacterium]|nr:hypothetical protein [Bacilli bacterium]